jgi:FtsZ-interacting cell division protein ZipA
MSEFQTSLLLIGALVVVGVIAYNKWQEHRAGKATDEVFRSSHPDVLIGEEAGSRSLLAEEAPRIEPGNAPPQPQTELRPAAVPFASPSPDPCIDYVVELGGAHPIPVVAVRDLWSGVEHRFSRRAAIAGLFEGEWGPLPQGGACDQVRAALQMVSRKGVVSHAELLEFRSEVETLAAKLGVPVNAPEMKEALEGAQRLDRICAAADIQIAFHVVAPPGAPFSGTKLRAAAEAAGLALDGEGRFSLADERGRELYNLADRDGSRFAATSMKEAAPLALTLSMDVPRVPDTQRTFEAMVRFGRSLADLLGGGLVDDNNQPLDDRAVAAIDAQLAVVRGGLQAEGIVPGSALALRLFS